MRMEVPVCQKQKQSCKWAMMSDDTSSALRSTQWLWFSADHVEHSGKQAGRVQFQREGLAGESSRVRLEPADNSADEFQTVRLFVSRGKPQRFSSWTGNFPFNYIKGVYLRLFVCVVCFLRGSTEFNRRCVDWISGESKGTFFGNHLNAIN